MKGVALEQAPYGVRANCVCPGATDTAWMRGPDSPIEPAAQATIGAMIPLGRRGIPEEMANIFALDSVFLSREFLDATVHAPICALSGTADIASMSGFEGQIPRSESSLHQY